MVAKMLRHTRIQLLLSLNAVAILIAGLLIAGAIGLTGGGFNAVNERNDEMEGEALETRLIGSAQEQVDTPTVANTGNKSSGTIGSISGESASGADGGGYVGPNDLWGTDAITIYQTADVDICIDNSLPGYDNMYWQTADTSVIKGFYTTARSYLGYNSNRCRYPVIAGTGTTTITAGTYDGTRRDTIQVTVLAPPIDQWKRDILNLVNAERAKVGAGALSWGYTCEGAATLRATEIQSVYAHTRPDGSEWHTVCPIPASGGKSGENLAAGSSAVSPKTVMAAWMATEEHKRNILDKNYTKLAVGFVFDPNTQYKTYWSQIFSTY